MITAHHIHIAKKAIFTALAVWLAAYMFVILLTYTPNDPSWSHISSDMGSISNVGGAVGAWTSDILYTMLGWSAWWIIVFLAYEALSLWWHREQSFGMFRILGYLFLILASCGLVEIFSQLFGTVDSNELSHGGILGFELANRLAGLLTMGGATVFLLLFVIITATFAFDIRWLKAFHSLMGLSWLGSGIKSEPRKNLMDRDIYSSADHIKSDEDIYDENGFFKEEYTENSDDDTSTEGEDESLSPIFGQLSLELPENTGRPISEDYSVLPHNLNEDDSLESENILDDFLINSGISDSILNLQQQEAEAALQEKVNEQTIRVQTEETNIQPVAAQDSVDQDMPKKLIIQPEKSFRWRDQDDSVKQNDSNNQEALDDILERQSTAIELKPTLDSHPSDTEAKTAKITPVKINETVDIEHGKQASKEVSSNDDVGSIDMSIVETRNVDKNGIDKSNVETNSVDENSVKTNNADARLENDSALVHELQEAVDLTPTNTPPANPTKPPKVSQSEPVDKQESEPQHIKVTPKIQFATPEDGGGNHIEDMVKDSEDAPVMPDIHNDHAFATKSRSMQTAKYRSSLSPIPELSLLDKPDPDRKPSYNEAELQQLSELLEIKLQDFNVKAEVVNAIPGPVVTRFEVELAPGVKASKVTGISRDLARSLSMASLRVVEVIPGKPYIGIEVPNKKREMVRLIELLHTKEYKDPKAQISMAMGKNIGGKPIITDLARAPHMLVAGTTGSGKSVLVNSMLLSMLLKYTPNELRLILIDPKQLELANYNDIPHLLTPVVTDMNEAASSLSWCVAEMERRYQLMSLLKVRKLGEFNKKVVAAQESGRPMIDPLWRPNDSVSIDQAPKLKTLPMIVIVADEFADMIMQVGKQAEELITRLAQKSRAAGIHLMLATQRPSVDVITGLIKANIPVRAALRVNSKVDSRTILDAGGAEDMLGNGDMLFLGPGQIEPDRVHGAYVSDEEVNRICDAWRERGAPDYIDNMASNFELTSPNGSGNTSGEDDELYDQAVAFIMETRKVSASSIQRKFSIGYNRAARIVDSMEEAGLVSAMGKSGKRELLM